jgi:uncharacterized protein DUF349
MPLLDRFRSRPAWQSKDPEIRASAVRQLGPDQQELIRAIAREDEDPRVRRLAVRKLSDIPSLAAIGREDTDAGVRSEATENLEHMAMEAEEGVALPALEALGDARHMVAAARSARHVSVRRAALARLTDSRSLSAVARTADDAAIRQAALDAIVDVTVLADLALRSDHKDLAVHAAERLDDPVLLASVAARARNKAAARRAKAKLDALAARPAPPAFESQPAPSPDPESLMAQTEAPETAAPETAASEIAAPEPAASETSAPDERAAAEPAAAASGEEAADETADEATVAAVAEPEEPAAPAAPLPEPTDEQRAEQEEWCRQADAAADSGPALHARREVQTLRKRAYELAALAPELGVRFDGALARAGEREKVARLAREREQFDNQARLLALCERLEALAKAESVGRREAEQGLRESRSAAEQPPPLPGGKDARALMQRLKAARAALFPRVQEIREADEWTRWANATQQEELCRRIEALVTEEDLDKAATQLREIDAEWKKVAQAPRDQAEALWRRFKTGRDQVQVRCREHFARQAQERGENLKRKQALAEQAETLVDSTDWVRTAEALRKLQQEWKETGPVPRRHGKVLWERFRGACDRFFARRKEDLDRRKQDWAKNLEKKEALCARAEALEGSIEWDAASAEIKRLQAEWKTIGPVRKSKSQPLWDRFHGACDRFFERFKQRGTLERAARTAELEALATELEAVAEAAPADDTAQRVQDVLSRWRQAQGSADAALVERRNRAVALLQERHPESFRGTELDPSANLSRLEKLVLRVEAQLTRPEASGSLAERLREALASNTMGGKGHAEAQWREATAEVEAAQAAFKKLGPVPGAQGEALRRRFQSACERFFELRPGQSARTR